jgi:hypothetical protein
MSSICTYCGYNALHVVRDYTGAPYATCPRCHRANPFYRVNPQSEKGASLRPKAPATRKDSTSIAE